MAGVLSNLLCCPKCGQARPDLEPCGSCGWTAARIGTIVDAVGADPGSETAACVEAFYDGHPFPGYRSGDDAAALLDRASANPFMCWLDQAIPLDATVLDCGCGTGQISIALALRGPRRTIVAVDRSLGQLRVAEGFLLGSSATNVQLVRGDLFSLPLAQGAFDVVVCRGVIHHTADPFRALGAVARHVAIGGLLVLGFYERIARLPHAVRQGVARLLGGPVALLDPFLRRKDLSPEKRRAWIDDQYEHPVETSLSSGRVRRALRSSGFDVVGTFPTAGEDAGLVCLLARRQARA